MKSRADQEGAGSAGGTRKLLRKWDRALRPAGDAPWFEGAEEMPPFDLEFDGFSDSNAWWLSELCRIVYTPDARERTRFWHRRKPLRDSWLKERTPFEEVHSIHKTGCHAALFRGESREGCPFTILCFRGTSKIRQWIMNLTALPVEWDVGTAESGTDETRSATVHGGFKILFERVWSRIEGRLAEMPEPIVFTGHSLGAAFASLAASRRQPGALYTFGSPRIGNRQFAERIAPGRFPHFRLVNPGDLVCSVPQPDERLGDQNFEHAGKLILLGECDADGLTDEPLRLLGRSLRESAEPPACILSHLPKSYSDKLRRRIHGQAI